jgi:hypothetical protein
MVKVFCPQSGREEWASVSGKGKEVDPKCTKCGIRHKALRSS